MTADGDKASTFRGGHFVNRRKMNQQNIASAAMRGNSVAQIEWRLVTIPMHPIIVDIAKILGKITEIDKNVALGIILARAFSDSRTEAGWAARDAIEQARRHYCEAEWLNYEVFDSLEGDRVLNLYRKNLISSPKDND